SPRSGRAAERVAFGPALARRSLPLAHHRSRSSRDSRSPDTEREVMRARAVVAQTRAELALTMRRGESLIVTLAIPLGILVFFAKVDTIATDYKKPVDFLVPGVLALAVMSAAMVSLGIATGFERRYGVLKRLGSTPLGRSGLLTAKTLTVVTVEVIQAAVIVVAGLILGWSPSGNVASA